MTEAILFDRHHSQENYMRIARQIRSMILDGKPNVSDRFRGEKAIPLLLMGSM
jgi:hypothetical protein